MASLAHHNSGILIPRDEYEELTEALATVFRIGARFTPRLIERLDLTDGDPDLEDATDLEDDFSIYTLGLPPGPGCPIADTGEDDDPAGGAVDDEPHDPDGDQDTAEPIRGGGSGDYPGGSAA